MARWGAFLFLAGFWGAIAQAEDTALQSLRTGVEAGEWQAVGRLDLNGKGFCTGALIGADLVLTAAHCLFDKVSGQRINYETIEFLAGWRDGRASAYRQVSRAVIHPEYRYAAEVSSDRVRTDIALLKLAHPIRNTTIDPFETAPRPRKGAVVGVVSYARDRSEVPSLQQVCKVLGRQQGVLVTSCAVDFGASGAPIFTLDQGRAQIVSIVSAKAEMGGAPVSLGTSLGAPLDLLRAELLAGKGGYQASPPPTARLGAGERSNSSGAKFIKPPQ